jgi:hypothetical protein
VKLQKALQDKAAPFPCNIKMYHRFSQKKLRRKGTSIVQGFVAMVLAEVSYATLFLLRVLHFASLMHFAFGKNSRLMPAEQPFSGQPRQALFLIDSKALLFYTDRS